jgi:PAS domain S-box-containing protein
MTEELRPSKNPVARSMHAAEELFRVVVEASPSAILVVNDAGIVIMANHRTEQLFGYHREELINQPVEFLVPDRFRRHHPEMRESFLKNPTARPMGAGRDLFGRRKDGSEVPIEIGLSPIETAEGTFVLANIIDITERLRAEEQFRVVVEAVPNAILVVDDAGHITLANTQAEQMFGYSRSELIGEQIEMLTPERYRLGHPPLRASFFAHPSTRSMGAGRELFGRRKDGSEVPIEIGLNPFETGTGMFVLASIIDITERKRREEDLRLQSSALECAANAIVITDLNGKIVWVNPAFTESTGYTEEEVQGKNPRILKSGQQDSEFYQNMWNTILSGKVWRDTVINRRKDGTLNREDMTITPIQDKAGRITHFVAIKQDITELEQLLAQVRAKNDELAMMTQQLWQASRLATVGELAASIAHELNNPLATVSLKLETLESQLTAEPDKLRSVQIVSDEVERMGNLVGNLLQFSRRTHRQISTVDLQDEIDKSLELVEYHMRSNRIQIALDYAEELPMLQVDRQQLRQVFLNLLTNATDAMKDGGTLTVRAKAAPGNNNRARIEFIDTGAGIEPANLEKIWDPFFTTKPEGKGTGLGLAICRRVIEEHQGSIAIESELGQWTKITIELPTSGATNGIAAAE